MTWKCPWGHEVKFRIPERPNFTPQCPECGQPLVKTESATRQGGVVRRPGTGTVIAVIVITLASLVVSAFIFWELFKEGV